MTFILGIDDAGRGPVIGPMVLAGCMIDEGIEKEFKELGVKDSKAVLPAKRETLAKIIKEKSHDYEITVIPASEIDSKMKSGTNLNKIEALYCAEIINKINKGVNILKVVIDCPSNNTKSWQTYLESHIQNLKTVSLLCVHKADRDYVAVAAGSILAKTTRDAEVVKIKKEMKKKWKIDDDIGSGYPSDPLTMAFLKKYVKKLQGSGIVRESWQTWKNEHTKTKQKSLGDY